MTWLDKLITGADGANAYSVIAVSYVQPAVGGTVTITVDDTSWMPSGLAVFTSIGGNYSIVTALTDTQVTIRNSGGASNAAPGAVVSAGALLSSAGQPGAAGANGVSGAGILSPVDAVATSNVTQSGTTSVDGVTLTANVSRVLCVGQAAAAQNGIKLVQVGAWTNPTDFSSDAQVIIGQNVYVKPGGLTGGDTNWQLKTGTTIAGAKTYAQSVGAKLAPVRVVQTIVLPTHTVATQTLTSTTNGALFASLSGSPSLTFSAHTITRATGDFLVDGYAVGQTVTPLSSLNFTPFVITGVTSTVITASATSFVSETSASILISTPFDLTVPLAVGDRVEVNSLNVAHARNGIYVVTQIGDAANPWILTRAGDLNAGSKFASGASYEVLDGSTLKGSRRYITNQGTVTVGTTAIATAPVREQDLKEVDLSKAPYFVKSFPTGAAATADNVDQAPAIRQFVADAFAAGGKTGRLPAGYITLSSPIDALDFTNVSLKGAGPYQTTLQISQGMNGGIAIQIGKWVRPAVYGTVIDTAGNMPLDMYNFSNPPYINLTRAGWYTGTLSTFHITMRWRPNALDGGLALSTRGAEQIGDSVSVGLGLYPANADGSATAQVRVGGVLYTLNSGAGKVVAGHNYCYDITYDGTTITFYVSENGAARDATPATQAATGSYSDNIWEDTLLGYPNNDLFPESGISLGSNQGAFGSIRLTSTVQAIPATTGTSVPFAGTILFYFIPTTASAYYAPDGVTYLGWRANITGGAGGYVQPRTRNTALVTASVHLADFRIKPASVTALTRATGVRMTHSPDSSCDRVRADGLLDGLLITDASFFSRFSDCTAVNCKRIGLGSPGAGLVSYQGTTDVSSCIYALCCTSGSVNQSGQMTLGARTGCRALILGPGCASFESQTMNLNDEGSTTQIARAAVVMSVADGFYARLRGLIYTALGPTQNFDLAWGTNQRGMFDLDMAVVCATPGTLPIIKVTGGTAVQPIILGDFFQQQTTPGSGGFCNVPSALRSKRTSAPIPLTNQRATIGRRMKTATNTVSLVSPANVSRSGLAAIDSITPVNGVTRTLLTGETSSVDNGIWITAGGAWTRATDMDVDAEFVPGTVILVYTGTVYSWSQWRLDSGTTLAGAKVFSRCLIGDWFRLAAGTLTAAGAYNLGVDGAVPTDQIRITVEPQSFDAVFTNLGSGGGAFTLASSASRQSLTLQFDGTDWLAH
jgi:hypothetical protein